MTVDLRHPLPGTCPLVVGAARSGLAACRLLARHGADVRLADRAFDSTGGAELAMRLRREGVAHDFAGDQPAALEGRDFVVWSPGIPDTHPIAATARARALPVISELELGYLAAHAPLLCITGTNGKSTTTDLVGALVRSAGRETAVCGNIGRPICDVAESVSAAGLLVVEVSSFQLETVDRLRPYVATWLNLTPDHLERHGDLAAYGALKQRLFARQEETDWSVWNADDPEVVRRRAGRSSALTFSRTNAVAEGAYVEPGRGRGTITLAWRGGTEPLLPAEALRIPGAHNLGNALAALATVLPLEIAPATLRETLRDYAGLEHRLEPVATIDGVAFVNDSKATNLASLEVALQSFERPVVLIAGGRDKGQDFAPYAGLVQRTVAHLVLIGEGASRIGAAWSAVPAALAASLAEAVDTAFDVARKRGAQTVLLSPACASFDMFQDYEDRGRRFKAEVDRLRLAEGAPRLQQSIARPT